MIPLGKQIANEMRARASATPGEDRLSPAGRRVVERALREALSRGTSQIGPEHLLFALLSGGDGPVVSYLRLCGVKAGSFETFESGFVAGEKAVVRT